MGSRKATEASIGGAESLAGIMYVIRGTMKAVNQDCKLGDSPFQRDFRGHRTALNLPENDASPSTEDKKRIY